MVKRKFFRGGGISSAGVGAYCISCCMWKYRNHYADIRACG